MIPIPFPMPAPMPFPFPPPPGFPALPSPGQVIQAGINFAQDIFTPPDLNTTLGVLTPGGGQTNVQIADGVVSSRDFRNFVDWVNRQFINLRSTLGAGQSYGGYQATGYPSSYGYGGYPSGYGMQAPMPQDNSMMMLMLVLLLSGGLGGTGGTLSTTTLLILMMAMQGGGFGGGGMGGMDPMMLVILLTMLP